MPVGAVCPETEPPPPRKTCSGVVETAGNVARTLAAEPPEDGQKPTRAEADTGVDAPVQAAQTKK